MLNSRTLKAILVDDEAPARRVLENLLDWSDTPIEVVARCADLPSAVTAIEQHRPDVVFLDVQMPKYAGFEIVRFIDPIDFEIIFVTAFDQYAIQAFELSALDYLVKPVERERLAKALDKVHHRLDEKNKLNRFQVLSDNLRDTHQKQVVISELRDGHIQQQPVVISDIVAVEAQRAYSVLHLADGTRKTVSRNLKSFEDVLAEHGEFVRTHRSWLVNVRHIASFSMVKGQVALKTGVEARVVKTKIHDLESALSTL